MKPNRTLALDTERLADLTPDDLASVAGAGVLPTRPVNGCLTIDKCVWTRNINCVTHTCAD